MREKSLSSSPVLQKASHRILSGGAELTVCCVSVHVSPTQHVGLCAGAGAGKLGVRSRLFTLHMPAEMLLCSQDTALKLIRKPLAFRWSEVNKLV